MAASGQYVCHQARVLFAEGLGRMASSDERREALKKLLIELMQVTDDEALEKTLRLAYNDLSVTER